jgi:IS30 family transposase
LLVEEYVGLIAEGVAFMEANRRLGVSFGPGLRWWAKFAPVDFPEELFNTGRTGGLRGAPPPATVENQGPRDGRRALSEPDRAVIAACRANGMSLREIGALVGRHHSVVGRELERNSGPGGDYHHKVAHRAAHERRRRPKAFRLATNSGLCRAIEGWMGDGWSPQLIASVLREDPGRSKMDRVGHETIYQALYVQGRGGLRRDLAKQLSTGRTQRKPRGSVDARGRSLYREAFKISQRPADVEDRAVPGHWEGDLVIGAGSASAVGTLVERTTRFVMLLHLPGRHDADSVAEAMIKQMAKLPEHLRQSLTWDRGVELARYRDITMKLDMPVYFCDPHSPWQRGSNENTNRLLRHWLTKGTDLSRFTAADLDGIAAKLNARPRPTLGMKTPAQALAELLANPAAA